MFYPTFKQYLILTENNEMLYKAYKWMLLHPASVEWLSAFKKSNDVGGARKHLRQNKAPDELIPVLLRIIGFTF